MRRSTSPEDIPGRDMLRRGCPHCRCAEEAEEEEEAAAALPSRVHVRLLRMARVVSVSVVLLLGMVLAILTLLLFGPPAGLRRSKVTDTEPENALPNLSDVRREKLQSDQKVPHPSALLTIPEKRDVFTPEWQFETGNAHIGGGMRVSRENLTVPVTGLYKLYLQATFDFNHHAHQQYCADDQLSLRISVQRCSATYPAFRPVLASEDTMSCAHDWMKTMSMSGSFELQAHSVIQVRLQKSELVNHQDIFTFFGAELISALE